ncbi:hypothetical protein ACOME3_001672 [Neoechinorhynchus agilis]
MVDTETPSDFRVYLALQFIKSEITSSPVIPWVIGRLKESPIPNGGGGLLVKVCSIKHTGVIVQIGAKTHRLLSKAEELGFKKRCKDGSYQEFKMERIDDFVGGEDPDSFLTEAEAIFLISNILEWLMPPQGTTYIPGFADLIVKPYYTLVHALKKRGFLKGYYPVHDPEQLHRLQYEARNFYSTSFEPEKREKLLGDFCGYFGHEVAFYFAFYRAYIQFLALMSAFGLLSWLFAYFEFKTRSLFYGDRLVIDPVTNKKVLEYPFWKRFAKQFGVTYPLIIAYCALSVYTTFAYFKYSDEKIEDKSAHWLSLSGLVKILPGIVHSTFTDAFRKTYSLFVRSLNNFENHRTKTDYFNALTTKMAVFHSANCFLSLLLTAFLDLDFSSVSKMLYSIFLVKVMSQKANKTLVPYLTKKFKKLSVHKDISQVEKEASVLVPYNESKQQNYSGLFEQFGLVCMFSSLFPWVPLAALFCAIVEMRSDEFMILHVYQRPIPRLSQGIGPWLKAIEALSVASVAINLTVIALQPQVRKIFESYSDIQYIVIFILVEHALLAIRYALKAAIQDEPQEIKAAVAKALYSKQAQF